MRRNAIDYALTDQPFLWNSDACECLRFYPTLCTGILRNVASGNGEVKTAVALCYLMTLNCYSDGRKPRLQ